MADGVIPHPRSNILSTPERIPASARQTLITACLAFAVAFATACIGACSVSGPILNSERIEDKFGSYGVDVIHSADDTRLSSLYSGSGSAKVTRTIAVVIFSEPIHAAIASEHAAVLSGQSLGAVFKAAAWSIKKHTLFVGELNLSSEQAIVGDLMQLSLPRELATHVYSFNVSKDGRTFEYATIVEIHHPDYLSVADLKSIYGEILFDDSQRTAIDDFVDPQLWKN